jgi:hypothetical protein
MDIVPVAALDGRPKPRKRDAKLSRKCLVPVGKAAADDDTIVQWTEFHEFRSRLTIRCRPRATFPGIRLGP